MSNEESQSSYMLRMIKKRSEGGFTLIELLIVIIILAILAAIVVFAVGTTGQNAAAASCESDAKTVETALETYKAELNNYPAADAWGSLTSSTTVGNNTYGPFLRSQPGTDHYAINFNATGAVSADPSTVTTYTPADDVDNGTITLPKGAGTVTGLSGICNTNSH
jgi:prepilin-type N-terminal cleavage/methylation domain-containing protein